MKTTSPLWISDSSEIPDPLGYGQRAVDFLRVLKHPKSRSRNCAFELPAWQERIVRRIYGGERGWAATACVCSARRHVHVDRRS